MPADPALDARGGLDAVALLRAAGRVLLRPRRSLAWLLPAAWMAMVWWLSAQPDLIDDRWGLPVWLESLLHDLAHPATFGLLALWLVPLLPRVGADDGRWVAWSSARAGLVFALVVAYGALDETHQAYVPGRCASVFDLLADATGAAAVLTVVAYLSRADAERAGVLRRLALGALACVAAAALSSASGWFIDGGLWPLP